MVKTVTMKSFLFFLKFVKMAGLGIAGILAVFYLSSFFFSGGELDKGSTERLTKGELEELRQLKDQSIDPDHPLRVQVQVDYGQGRSASWYPKLEAPVLHSLVEAGTLPPLSQRVPEDPLVMRGVDGVGHYGGTMYRLGKMPPALLHAVHLVRFSPQGFPIVPHLAKSWTISDGGRVFTFTLRKGTRWSDGHLFTSADILYWWEAEQCDPILSANGPDPTFRHCGVNMCVSAPDPLTVVFSFKEPFYLFLEQLAGAWPGTYPLQSPAHFLKTYHPVLGDKEKIHDVMKQHNLVNEKAVYAFVKGRVECPSLLPWIPKTEHATPPETYVRNPYYFAVDTKGRQLPYMDRVICNNKSRDMMTISAAQGEVTAQSRFMSFNDYTMLMRQRSSGGYQVYHWQGAGAPGLAFNLNRRVPKRDREVADKAKLLKDKRFRQALSLAVDRNMICEALLGGVCQPHAIGPVAPSYFHIPGSGVTYLRYDPEAASRLLDLCGLTERDADGFRRFPNGPSLLFDINCSNFTGSDFVEFIIDDWRNVGINARIRQQERSLFYVEKAGGLHDISLWGGYGNPYPILDPRNYFPFSSESNFAVKHARWYASGGLYGATTRGVKPPVDSPLYQGMLLYERLKRAPTLQAQRDIFAKMLAIAEEQVYVLNISTPPPAIGIVKNGVRNVPKKGALSWPFQSPLNLGIETWCYDKPEVSPAEMADLKKELSGFTPIRPLHGAAMATASVSRSSQKGDLGSLVTTLLFYSMGVCLALFIILGILRYPFLGHRLLIMIPTLFIISVISFMVIELPPGDAITSQIMTMEEEGGQVDQNEIQDIKTLFRTEQPAWKRYIWWMGIDWFFTFDAKDKGLLQGNMGRSMIDLKPVNEKVGDRLLFTFLISLGTILFTWAIALPIGIYSAVRQYTLFDYIFTIGGFIGMCVPGFLLALLLMFGAETLFGLKVSGLFSPEYAAQTGWSTGKIMDLLRHLWLPVLVQGISGTAGMIRVMRANLLDELKKPYVITARAKGLRPFKLLLKYPVRIALNPFISGIGGIFPHLISGGAIVAIVMSLPTIGPMQLDAVMQQDMYLAGSMLMVLSMLSVLGTLFSDILLLFLDPRIRMGGGTR